MVLANDQIFDYLHLISDKLNDQETVREVAFSRLRQIYFAFVALSGAVILFKLFCPREIKENADRYEFVAQELKIAEPIRIIGFLKKTMPGSNSRGFPSELLDALLLQKKDEAQLIENINNTTFWSPLEPDGDEIQKAWSVWKEENKSTLITVLGNFYDFQNHKRFVVRVLTLSLFAYGFVQLAWPSLVVLSALISSTSLPLN